MIISTGRLAALACLASAGLAGCATPLSPREEIGAQTFQGEAGRLAACTRAALARRSARLRLARDPVTGGVTLRYQPDYFRHVTLTFTPQDAALTRVTLATAYDSRRPLAEAAFRLVGDCAARLAGAVPPNTRRMP